MPIFSAGSASVSIKRCNGCQQDKPLEAFCHRAQSPDGLNAACRSCVALYKRGLRKADPLYERKQFLKAKYKITLERYYELVAAQDGVCAICGVEPESGQFLQVDHDHGCCPGKVTCGQCLRGLLCGDCNTGIGCFGDSPALVSRAVDYLKGGHV